MFTHAINSQIELRLIQHEHCRELFNLMEINRDYLRAWHPWVDAIRHSADLERFIAKWLNQFSGNRGFHSGIWHDGKLCGVINHLNIDWQNRSTALSYWLDESHQGRGIMTLACQEFVSHAFRAMNLNRVTIECATDNIRSRRIPQRLAFRFEGIIRASEWLHDHFADHAVYGLLKGDLSDATSRNAMVIHFPAAGTKLCDLMGPGALN